MRYLVIGKGGREHAIARALVNSASVDKVFACPGSQGMGAYIESVSCDLSSEALSAFCLENNVDVIVIGPEDPLVAGLATELRKKNHLVFGPGKDGAELEGSKIFSKNFMEKYQIPTSAFKIVKDVEDVMTAQDSFTPPYVLKADGLAAGKGVFICKTSEELEGAAKAIFGDIKFGDANEALMEQFQPGYELSYFVLTNGEKWVSLPLAQDHKKLLENDEGPNTGGMGTVAPMIISDELKDQIESSVVASTIKGFQQEAFDYKGVVFIGLMITSEGPQVLEYNVRFGDPETQVLMPLLDGDWGLTFKAIAQGELPQLKWKEMATACVVLAAENYPDSPVKGVTIEGDVESENSEGYFLHAGTQLKDGSWQTNGGRVLNAIGVGQNLNQAIANAYKQSEKINWNGMQFRKDIGSKATQ